MTEAQKILIVGPSWVGDMVMAQALFMALKHKHPDAAIDVLAPAWSLPILERMPEVSNGIAMPVGHGQLQWHVRRELGISLRKQHYHQAIVLPNSLKSALVPFFAKIPRRTGWRGEMRYGLLNDLRVLDKQRYPLMVERFVALAGSKGVPLPEPIPRPALLVDQANVERLLAQYELMQTPFLALCPGAEFGPAKRWPEQHYADVAAHFIERGWKVVLFGSANDASVAASIIHCLPEAQRSCCINLAGTTQLSEAVDLLSAASAVVSNDSGLMHIAAALSLPLAVVYGSTSPQFTPPLSDCVRVLQLELECRPCFKRECPLEHLQCLRQLMPEQVIRALNDLLAEPVKEVVS